MGFLRIASRLKTEGSRRSRKFRRRFTGAKGVGRLAAHKLARVLEVESVPSQKPNTRCLSAVSAAIDWDKVESFQTIDEVADSVAVKVTESKPRRAQRSGTVITLKRLRKRWTPTERTRFLWEVQSFQPPPPLLSVSGLPKDMNLLFDEISVADIQGKDPGFSVALSGDFEAGEEYWQALADAASWIVEIDAHRGHRSIQYLVTPTKQTLEANPEAAQEKHRHPHPNPVDGPFFQARFLVREGTGSFSGSVRPWINKASGIRVYMEGFRVLPYGDTGDDWLDIASDYGRRSRRLQFIEASHSDGLNPKDPDEGLSFLPKESYSGGVFLTEAGAPNLRMLVNREGFVPEASFDSLKRIVRTGIDLSVRVRAKATLTRRRSRKQTRLQTTGADRLILRHSVEQTLLEATHLAEEANVDFSAGRIKTATRKFKEATARISEGSEIHNALTTERSVMQILAGIGLQMTAFVHEINGLLAMAYSLESVTDRLRKDKKLPEDSRRRIASLHRSLGDLRRVAERQASYLTDVTSPDARRRRSRRRLAEAFDASLRLHQPSIERRDIQVTNTIEPELKTPPMFPAELVIVFSNILTNAVKATRKEGRIRASARTDSNGKVRVRVENTGKAVNLNTAERWFKPFESTTTELDPALGQGMGMGLPIARNILEEYGAQIAFVRPRQGYASSIELVFP